MAHDPKSHRLYVAVTKEHGRGVFAAQPFKKGEVIERCPILLVPLCEHDLVVMKEYIFDFHGTPAIALGLGSLYNHSRDPNVWYSFMSDGIDWIEMRAARDIDMGEQLFVDYGI